jgi:hypothetical protein
LDARQQHDPLVGGRPQLTDGDLQALRELTESQSARSLRRYLDYGKRLRSGTGLDELSQWLGKILLDDGSVYDLSDRSMAFEIAACERIRGMRTSLLPPHYIGVPTPCMSNQVPVPKDRSITE